MIPGDDFVYFLPGRLVQRARSRLIVDERDDIGCDASVEWPEVVLHGMEGNETPQVEIHVVAVANLLQRPNHGKSNTVEQNRCADGRAAGEECATHFVANDDDGSLLGVIHVVDPATLV